MLKACSIKSNHLSCVIMKNIKLNVLTHLHTKASNGPASSLNEMAQSILAEVFRDIPQDLIWRECFTDADDIRQILAGERTKTAIDILFLTDHMSSRYHRVDNKLLQLAAEERRIGVGCEIQTVRFSKKTGTFLVAPEVLIYGDQKDRYFNGKPYTGIDNTLLEELYQECTLPHSGEPEIFKIKNFCRKRNIVCALAHPFDCQLLDLDETLDVIRAFTFVETINGGFPRRSANALQEYVALHNNVLRNASVSSLIRQRCTNKQLACVEKINESTVIVPLGGSDAHLNNFDRVVTRFTTTEDKAHARDFISMMLDVPPEEILQKELVEPIGRGISTTGLYRDVLGVIINNLRVYSHHFNRPKIWPRLLKALSTKGYHEYRVRIARNKSISADYRNQLELAPLCKAVEGLTSNASKKNNRRILDMLPSEMKSGRSV